MSSDYGDDDGDFLLKLDDDDLRILEEVEEKCGVQVSHAKSVVSNTRSAAPGPSTRGANPPPPKRTKVTGRPLVQAEHLSDDDTPDILVNADGTYSLESPEPSLVSIRQNSLGLRGPSRHPASEAVQQRSVSTVLSGRNGAGSAAPPLQRHDSNTSMNGLDTPPSTQGTQGARPLVRAASLSQAISRGLARGNTPLTQQPARVENHAVNRAGDANPQKEIEALRAQLAQAESERRRLRDSLEETKENSFAKAGEAENLRRTMQKQNEQHAEEIARLRQEMKDAENAKLDLEHRMKLEMDQLRTSLTFKKTAGARKQPDTKFNPFSIKEYGCTTLVASFSQEESNENLYGSTTPPRKEKSFGVTNSFNRSTSPVKPMGRLPKPSQSVLDHDDSFAPVHTSTQHPAKDKGKGKVRPEDSWSDDHTSTPVQRLTFGTQPFWDLPRPATQAPFALEPDVFGSSVPPKTPARVVESAPMVDIIEPVDYADELRMILLTHVILFRPPEGEKTFSLQHLLTTSVPTNLHKRFNAACTGLFDAFSTSSNVADGDIPVWDQCATRASLALAQIAQVFNESEHSDTLRILFSLLNAVCMIIPSFAGYLLKAGVQEGSSILASTICSVILKCTKDKLDETILWQLGENALTLCETLGWQAMDDGVVQLSVLARTAGVLPLILDVTYPPLWAVRATRALSVLASRPALVRGLLSFPETSIPTPNDPTKVPLVELLCKYLSAYKKNNIEEHHRELFSNILTTLSQLAITDTQSLTTLVDSLTLIPSLVSFIYHVTSSIWSELDLVENRTLGEDNCLIDALRLAIQLLHYLSFSSDPEPNVRERLCYAPRGPFNGLVHMFIVAFGRLSSGDPPEYLDETCSASIREMRGVSEALLGIVVDGPEVEGIYDVFHDLEEDEDDKVEPSVEDEEEEALQMALDEF